MIKKSILVAFGKKVRDKRKLKGLSQEQLSFKADLHRTYIGMIERAEKNITLVNIGKIAKALELEVSEFLERAKYDKTDPADFRGYRNGHYPKRTIAISFWEFGGHAFHEFRIIQKPFNHNW